MLNPWGLRVRACAWQQHSPATATAALSVAFLISHFTEASGRAVSRRWINGSLDCTYPAKPWVHQKTVFLFFLPPPPLPQKQIRHRLQGTADNWEGIKKEKRKEGLLRRHFCRSVSLLSLICGDATLTRLIASAVAWFHALSCSSSPHRLLLSMFILSMDDTSEWLICICMPGAGALEAGRVEASFLQRSVQGSVGRTGTDVTWRQWRPRDKASASWLTVCLAVAKDWDDRLFSGDFLQLLSKRHVELQ